MFLPIGHSMKSLYRGYDRATGGFARSGRKLAEAIQWGEIRDGWPTVLCFDRALFTKDITELKRRTEINWPTIHTKLVKAPQERWVPHRLQRQTFFANDLNTTAIHLREPLREFATAFLTEANRRSRIDAVMAANTDYWQDESMRLAARDLGIPFLVLSRESYGIGRGRRYVTSVYDRAKFRFVGTGCAVASATCESFMSALPAMQGVTVRATGWPRYDLWSDYADRSEAERRTVTLMAYGDPIQVQYAAGNFADVLKVFVASARAQLNEPPEQRLRYVIKLKKANEDGYIRDLVPDIDRVGIEIVSQTPLPELISESRAVIGYNTLAVLEALLSNCAVIVPFWGDAERNVSDSLLHPDVADDERVCYFPRSAAAFKDLSDQIVAGTLKPKANRDDRLARFSRHSEMRSDRSSSLRVQDFVQEILKAKAP